MDGIDPSAPTAARVCNSFLGGEHHFEADRRLAEPILADPALTAVLDLAQPVGGLANAVLHAIPDADDPAGLIARYRTALAPGNFLVLAHGTTDGNPELAARLTELSRPTSTPVTFRTGPPIAALFDGFDLVEPGLEGAPIWRPDPGDELPEHPERSGNRVGVARRDID